MLSFFRKNQRIFFLFITIITIITFVFFGTYNVLSTSSRGTDETAFEAVNGKKISSNYLEQMAYFLRSDVAEASLSQVPNQAVMGNFLNDGVLAKDFLESGMAQIIFERYWQDFMPDLQARLEKEKYYRFYQHPYAGFLAAEAVWQSFAPSLKNHLDQLRSFKEASSLEAFNHRIGLYLEERRFPPLVLKQVLSYQEGQYEWLPHDANITRESFALFNYHDANDWFGPKFVKRAAEIIINTAALAKQKGYKVSQDEALADLIYRSELALQSQKERSSFKSGYAYFQNYLRLAQMDEVTLVKLWQDVLLFRRYFNDIGSAVIVDPISIKEINDYANQSAEIGEFALAEEFRFNDFQKLQEFELYLDQVASKKDALLLPNHFKTPEEVEETAPELVEKRYQVDIAQFDRSILQSKVTVKETWEWELKEENWELLKKQFPELGLKTATNDEERFSVLDNLEERLRQQIDLFARNAIVNRHTDWMQDALNQVTFHEQILAIPCSASVGPLKGIKNTKDLLDLFEVKPIGEEFIVSQDNETFYRFVIKEKCATKNVLTFKQASEKGILEKMLKEKLKTDPNAYDFVLIAIQKDCSQQGITIDLEKKNELVKYRFFAHMRNLQKDLASGSQKWVASSIDQPANPLEKPTLDCQWKVNKNFQLISRSRPGSYNLDQILALKDSAYSSVQLSENSGLYFYQFMQPVTDEQHITSRMKDLQTLLGSEAKCNALRDFLHTIDEKKAISQN